MKSEPVTTLLEFLPFTAAEMFAVSSNERPGAVPEAYEIFNADGGCITRLQFQSRPMREGLNGFTIEMVIAALLDRLRRYQRGPAASEENQQAIHRLEEALMWLRLRVERKLVRGTYRRP